MYLSLEHIASVVSAIELVLALHAFGVSKSVVQAAEAVRLLIHASSWWLFNLDGLIRVEINSYWM